VGANYDLIRGNARARASTAAGTAGWVWTGSNDGAPAGPVAGPCSRDTPDVVGTLEGGGASAYADGPGCLGVVGGDSFAGAGVQCVPSDAVPGYSFLCAGPFVATPPESAVIECGISYAGTLTWRSEDVDPDPFGAFDFRTSGVAAECVGANAVGEDVACSPTTAPPTYGPWACNGEFEAQGAAANVVGCPTLFVGALAWTTTALGFSPFEEDDSFVASVGPNVCA
jgi:hypothetical protein